MPPSVGVMYQAHSSLLHWSPIRSVHCMLHVNMSMLNIILINVAHSGDQESSLFHIVFYIQYLFMALLICPIQWDGWKVPAYVI